MRIDTSKACAALGIKHPVRFEATGYAGSPTAAAGVSPLDPSVIYINPAEFTRHSDAKMRHIIAHELVHVAQMAKIGDPHKANWLYQRENEQRGYKGNRFEIEANAVAEEIAPLVEVTA